jgi:hypothetical protein
MQSEGHRILSKANIVGRNLVETGDAGPVSDMCPVRLNGRQALSWLDPLLL